MNRVGRIELALRDSDLAPAAAPRRAMTLAAITLCVAILSFAIGLAAR